MIEAAIEAGRNADRLGTAFLAGYRSAVSALVGRDEPAALCVTETGPPHPRSIRTRWTDGRVTGEKSFVTGVQGARTLWVAARAGEDGDRVQLVLVPVDVQAPGLTLIPLPPTRFAPEIGHARVVFQETPSGPPLPGDGWHDAVKPFRTVEDVHVFAAITGYALRAATERQDLTEDLLAGLMALRQLSQRPPSQPDAHLAFAGVQRSLRPAIEAALDGLSGEEAVRWQRDRSLLDVASKARALRREAAWQTTRS